MLTPRLRFPEFRKRKAWVQKQAGELFTNRIEHGEDGLPIYSVTMDDGMVKRSSLDRKFDDIAESGGNKKVHKNDIAYNMMRMWQGAFGVAVEDCMVSPAYVVLTPQEGVSSDFFGRLLKTPCLLRSLTSQSHGLTKDRLRLYYKDFAQIALPLPSLAEQQKIADCLTSLDAVMAAQGRKVEALKAHKNGLMQELFPREGETIPRLRFPEFHNAPEWADRELGTMTTKVGSGITPLGGDKNYKVTGRPFIRSQNVGWGELLLDDVAFIDEETHSSFDATEIVESDVLLNITGASIGRSAITDARIVGGNVNQHVCIIRVKRDELNPVLLNQFLISERGQKQIGSFQAGGNRQGLNFAQIRAFTIPVPPTDKEQKRIADGLSTLDARIAAEKEKLAALKTHKQGLMQQLFPSPEVV